MGSKNLNEKISTEMEKNRKEFKVEEIMRNVLKINYKPNQDIYISNSIKWTN